MTAPVDLADIRRVMGEGPGGQPALRIAVVTPYHAEPEERLAECHRSVLAQSHPCTHILVADGRPAPCVDGWAAQHIVLHRTHADYGDTPRAVGCMSAVAQGFDAIAFLDADNWYSENHVQTMVELHHRARAAVCVASRALHRLDGSLLSASGEAGDGVDFIDTNCLFITSAAYRVLPVWSLMPARLHPIGDRMMSAAILAVAGNRLARSKTATVHYRTSFRVHYEERGETPPEGAKDNAHVLDALRWWRALPAADREIVFKRMGFRF